MSCLPISVAIAVILTTEPPDKTPVDVDLLEEKDRNCTAKNACFVAAKCNSRSSCCPFKAPRIYTL